MVIQKENIILSKCILTCLTVLNYSFAIFVTVLTKHIFQMLNVHKNSNKPMKGGKGTKGGSGSGGSYYSQPAYDDYYYYDEPSSGYYDNGGYGDYYGHNTGPGYVDDSLQGEDVVYLTAWQDNRFSSADPIYVTPNAPDPEAAGNIWLYADVPLQEESGIDVEPLLGFAQGTCQSLFSNQNGYCHFTYEFFDGLEVIASITVEGETEPTGPSVLTIVGGTGELHRATGEVILTPVALDETTTPPTVADDGSLFLGNPVGYYMEAIIYVSYRLTDIINEEPAFETISPTFDETEVEGEDTMDVEDPMTIVEEGESGAGQVVEFGRVVCPGMDAELDYCDCDFDCTDSPDTRCGCDAAWEDSCCGTAI